MASQVNREPEKGVVSARPVPVGGALPVPATPQPVSAKKPVPVSGTTVQGRTPQGAVAARPVAVSGTPVPAALPPDQENPEEPNKLDEVSALVIENSPPWLVSLVFHLMMLIIMGLIFYVNMPRKPIQLNAEMIYAEEIGDQLLFDAPGLPDIKTTADSVEITSEDLPLVDDPLAAPSNLKETRPDGTVATSDVEAPQIGMALTGRNEGSSWKRGLLGKYGGTASTEAAVQKGLEWLARNQKRDGSWSLAGPFSSGVSKDLDNETAATAMALLAFQGAGNTHQVGRFKKNVTRGWKWLMELQDGSGCFFQAGYYNHRFYTQGQCSIAICELYGMSKDPKYKEPAQKAIDYCLRTQSAEGGWRYSPNNDSDVSVTGWIVMALQSAKMAGLEVPEESLRHVGRFLDSAAQEDGSRYSYQPKSDVRLSMTAEALLMREYLGWKRDDPRLVAGMKWITSSENLINYNNNRDVYFWYYATQAAHHIEGEYWKRWNNVMRQAVPKQQVARGGEAGSWDPDRPSRDQWGNHGGRLYVTCLSIYMLEVYYRHLPLYTSVYSLDLPPVEKPAESKKPAEKDEKPVDGKKPAEKTEKPAAEEKD